MRLMQLDVPSGKCPGRGVPARQLERESVGWSGLAVVGDRDRVAVARRAVDLGLAPDLPGDRVDEGVSVDRRPLHAWTVRAVVFIRQVAPEGAALEAARDAEVALRARGRSRDPATAGHEIARRVRAGWGRWRGWRRAAGDVGVRRRGGDVGEAERPDV